MKKERVTLNTLIEIKLQRIFLNEFQKKLVRNVMINAFMMEK